MYVPYTIGKLKRLIKFFLTIFRLCRQQPDNILFIIQFKFSFLIGLFARSRKKILDYRTGDLSINPIRRWLPNRIMQFDSLFYNKLSVISEGLKKILKLPSGKTFLLPLGADVISLEPKNYSTIDLLYVGAIQHRNIYQTVIGLSLFLHNFPQARSLTSYTIIGFGSKQDILHLQETIEQSGLTHLVKYEGRIKYTGLKPYFDKCNVGVSFIPVTDYYHHQPATKTFEYNLSGLFTIATNTFENKKVIGPVNGVLCDDTPESFAKALEYFYMNRTKFNENSIRESLSSYHWEKIVKFNLLPILS